MKNFKFNNYFIYNNKGSFDSKDFLFISLI